MGEGRGPWAVGRAPCSMRRAPPHILPTAQERTLALLEELQAFRGEGIDGRLQIDARRRAKVGDLHVLPRAAGRAWLGGVVTLGKSSLWAGLGRHLARAQGLGWGESRT